MCEQIVLLLLWCWYGHRISNFGIDGVFQTRRRNIFLHLVSLSATINLTNVLFIYSKRIELQ